ncbi:hypothetical protein ACLOJK_032378 [Asimina triloba]
MEMRCHHAGTASLDHEDYECQSPLNSDRPFSEQKDCQIFYDCNVEKYEASNQRAIKTLEQYGATRLEVDVDGSIWYPEPLVNAKGGDRHSLPKPLNLDEELLMRVFYEHKIQEVCGAFAFPQRVQIEENHVAAEELGKGIQQDHEMILNNEMITLAFDLIVFAPYHSIEGFVDDMQEFCQANDDQMQKFKAAANLEADRMMLTDAPLLFPPGQLALAALRRVNEVHRILNFERYLDSILSRQNSGNNIFELTESLHTIDSLVTPHCSVSLVRSLKIPTAKDMRHIDRKLKNCWDPSSQDESKKREKRSKHKSRKSSNETQAEPVPMWVVRC